MFLSVVIPVYQAEAVLPELASRLATVLDAGGKPYEILCVDDGSTDGSWRVLEGLAKTTPHLTAVRLSRNFGQHYAITAGFDLARGEYVVLMDCDLQDPPEAIPDLLAKAEEGHDVVLAVRKDRKDAASKKVSGRLFYWLFARLTGRRLDATVGAFRVMRRRVVDAFTRMRETSRYFGAMVDWLGFDVARVEVEHAPRAAGRSSYSFRKLVALSVDGLVSSSNRPLTLSIFVGSVVAMAAVVYGVLVLLLGASGDPSVKLLLAGLAFLAGLILVNLGVLGVYVGRIYDQVKGRPLYVVAEIVGDAPEIDPA